MIGARLGAYEITAKLGAGGMGEVYRARDTKLDRRGDQGGLESATLDDVSIAEALEEAIGKGLGI